MKNLPIKIDVIDETPVVSTLTIAENIDKPNKTIVQLINKNLDDFLEFHDHEISNFAVQEIGVNGKAGYARYYNLNEQQATLLITYLRNNDNVRGFKKNLVKAFFMMKQRLENGIYKKELIKIHILQIGNKDTKTVDARELHTALKSTHVYENWIRKQTVRASLTKDIHYCEIDNEDTKTTYISVDSAKHIAMMSQSKTAHEVRDYLREIENTGSVQNNAGSFRESGGVSEIVPIITNFMEHQTKQTDLLIELVKDLKKDREQKPKTITKEQMKKIRSNAYIMAGLIVECEPFRKDNDVMLQLYRSINARMGVSSYYDIAYEDFDEAMEIQQRGIELWEEKLKNKQAQSDIDMPEIEF